MPPEECCSIPGFYALLEARADPTHPDYAEAAEWLGEYDPERIGELPIKYALAQFAARCNAARVRLAQIK